MSSVDLTQYDDLRDLGMLTAENLAVAYEYDDGALAKVHAHVTSQRERARKELAKEEDRAARQKTWFEIPAPSAVQRARQEADSAGVAWDRFQAQHPELNTPGAAVNPVLATVVAENRRLQDKYLAAEDAYTEAEQRMGGARLVTTGPAHSPQKRDQLATTVASLDHAAEVVFEARQMAKRRSLEMKARDLAASS